MGDMVSKEEVIEMLKEMQINTAKSVGFIQGMVSKAWVIKDLLGSQIIHLGGKPYEIVDGKMEIPSTTEK